MDKWTDNRRTDSGQMARQTDDQKTQCHGAQGGGHSSTAARPQFSTHNIG